MEETNHQMRKKNIRKTFSNFQFTKTEETLELKLALSKLHYIPTKFYCRDQAYQPPLLRRGRQSSNHCLVLCCVLSCLVQHTSGSTFSGSRKYN